MRLSELKQMVAEEYSRYLKEQAADPMVTVEPGDVDMGMAADKDSEATLRQIFDMLKAYFEGGAGAGVAPAGGAPEEMGDMTDMDAGDDMDMEDPGMDDGDDGDDAEEVEEEKEDKKDKKELKERFQKLANIIK